MTWNKRFTANTTRMDANKNFSTDEHEWARMKRIFVCYILGHQWKDYSKSRGYYFNSRNELRHRVWHYSRCQRCGWDTNEDPYYRELKEDFRSAVFKAKNFVRRLIGKKPQDDIPF